MSKQKTVAFGVLLLMLLLITSQSFEVGLDQTTAPLTVSTVPATSTFSYIVVIAMLNASLNNIIGNPLAPYLNYLANTWGLANDYTSLYPHRVANYIAMTSGDTVVSTDCVPFNSTKTTCPLSNSNIIDRIEGGGFTWSAWAEDYPTTKGCTTDTTSAGYDVKSFPFLYYTDITGNTARCNSLRRANTQTVSSGYETDDLFLNSLSSTSMAANYNWLSPNSCDSMHSCLPLSTVATADNYLSNLVPAILSSNIFQTQKAALLLTFAEGVQKTVSTTDYVPTIWAGPSAKTSYQSSNQYDHYSMLKTIETSWGLASLTPNDASATDMMEFLNAQLGVSLSTSPNPTEVGAQVKLNALASGGSSPYASFDWSFGDGSTTTTSSATTTHTYTTTGPYTATVTVTDSVGSKVTSSPTSIAVNQKLAVTPSATPKSTDAGMPVSFLATTTGGISPVTCAWTFGDSSTASGCSTSHTYTTAGAFTATVDATDAIGVTVASAVSVTIYSRLTVTVSASANPTEVGSQVVFTASSSGGTGSYTSYAWTFGDGATATTTTSTTTHTYSSAGTLSAKVTITDSAGSTATSSPLSVAVKPKLTASATASSTQTDVGVSDNFTATTDGGVGSPSCSWSFGDGSTDNICSTSHKYSSAGLFTVSLRVTDSLGVAAATSSVTVTVNNAPGVDFAFAPTSAFTGHPVNFTATVTGGTAPFSFSWDFGDGSAGVGNTVTHTYTVNGTFTVTLSIADAAGITSTQTHSLDVTLSFGVSITSTSPSPSEIGVQVSLSAKPVAGTTPYTCTWSFGDGTSSTGCSTLHDYSRSGNFTVTVNAADSTGMTASATLQIMINPTITATASASPSPTDAGFSAKLSAAISGGVSPAVCTWSFGDGLSGTGCSTTHIYATPGSFTANVTVTDGLGVVATGGVQIMVNPPLNPTGPSANPNPAEVGRQISFTLSVSGGTAPYTSYSWSFGDGVTVTTTSASATHTYPVAGSFTVSVTVTDSSGSKAVSSVSVTINPKLGVTAKANPDPTEVSKSTSFTETTTGGVGGPQCNWSFGDGSIATGCTTSHTYTSLGIFTASLTSVDSLGVTTTSNVTVTVNARLTTAMIASPNPTDASVPVRFNATISSGLSPVTCSWAFGDSSSATGCSTSHIYTAAGTFMAVLTGTDSLGLSATANVSVTVHPKLVATMSASPSLTEAGKLTGFTAFTFGGVAPLTCRWLFGDGASATGCSSIHTYTTAGTFTTNVTATDALGVTATSKVSITVNPHLSVVTLSASPDLSEVSKVSNFTDTISGGVGIATCSWDFGDGGTAGGCATTHIYTTAGNFTVALTATDALGVSAANSVIVNVQLKLTTILRVAPNPTEIGEILTFNDTTMHGVGAATCTWSYGDGSTDTGCLKSYVYTSSGTFKVIVNATDSVGVTVTASLVLTVNARLTVGATASLNPTVGVPVSFTTPYTGGISPLTCSWSFGDGLSVTGCSATHTYSAAGTFTPTVTALDSHNVSSTNSVNIVVALAVTVSFDLSPSEIGIPVTFTGSAAGGVSPYTFSWTFDDGGAQSGSITTHTFTVPRIYSVRVTVTDTKGDVGTAVRELLVQPSLTITLVSDRAGGVAPITIRLNATASWGVAPYTFSWNFGDGLNATGPSASHYYPAANSYVVLVIVKDKLGTSASSSLTIIVTSQPPAPVNSPTDPSAAGLVPAYYLVYGIVALFAVLVLVVPIYAIMIHRRHKRPI